MHLRYAEVRREKVSPSLDFVFLSQNNRAGGV